MIHQPFLLVELLDRFYLESEVMRNIAPRTIADYKNAFRLFLRENPRVIYLHQFDRRVIEDFLFRGRIERKWAAKTFINYLNNFKAFSTWCRKKGLLDHCPLKEIEKPKVEQRLPRFLTEDQLRKLIDVAFYTKYPYQFTRYRNRAMVGLMALAGLRVSEAMNLRLTDVNLESDTLFINQGKSRKDRLVPIVGELKIYLKAYLKDRDRLTKTHGWFLSSTCKNKPLTYSGVRNNFRNFRKKLRFQVSPHMLRHSFATLLLQAGVDIYSICQMMGHSDIKTTTIYLHATCEHLRTQIERHPLNEFRPFTGFDTFKKQSSNHVLRQDSFAFSPRIF